MTKKRWIVLVALCLCVTLCVTLVSCGTQEETPTDSTEPTETFEPGQELTYTVEVLTEGGMAMEGIGVYVYEDDTLTELVWFAKTDSDGKITFTNAASRSFVAVLTDVPEGYGVEDMYPLTAADVQIVLAAELVADDDLSGVTFKLGDVMYDLSVTAPDGTEYRISELLAEKEAVVLNFWYLECTPCKMEFPHLQEAYEQYSDKIALLALNPVDADEEAIVEYQKEMGFTFPVVQCGRDWQTAMQVTEFPTTIVIDRFGTIAMIYKGGITSTKSFEDIFAYFSDEKYEQAVVEDIESILSGEEDDDPMADNPTQISGVTSFQLTVSPGKVAYCDIFKVTDKMYLSVSSGDAFLIYNNKTYNPSGGSVTVSIQSDDPSTPVTIGLGNNGKETKTFTIYLSFPQGSYGNPYSLTLGEFTTSVSSGNDQGVYYTYTAPKDGTLTAKCLSVTAGVPYDFIIYNLSTYEYRNLGSDASSGADGTVTLSTTVHAGDRIQFVVATLADNSGAFPAATFKFLVELKEGGIEDVKEEETVVYAVTVTDAERQPISGAQVYFTVGDSVVNISTDEKGVAATLLHPGSYEAIVKVPLGYSAKTTVFQLTKDIPTVAVKLDKVVTEMETYTVNAVDESGAPVKNVLVSVGDSYGYTNAAGTISFTLVKDSYTAVIGAPEGYYADTVSYSFPSGTNTLTVQLKKGDGSGSEDPDSDHISYKVQVTDYFGNAMTGVTVTFLKDGAVVGLQEVDASGSAIMQLPKGSYTVSLSFGKGAYYYDADTAVLSEAVPSIKITAVQKLGDEYTQLYVGDAYAVSTGATYVDGMQENVSNFFMFTPTQSGVYEFTTSDPSAVISYWGSNSSFITDQTDATDYEDNAFTVSVKDENIGHMTCFFAVTGAKDCTILLTRIGDVYISPEEAAEWIIYQPSQQPTQFKLTLSSGQKLSYVNLAGKTSDYNLVKGADGYYHLNSATGPIMYVNLGTSAPYISMYSLLGKSGFGGASLKRYFYDDDGNFIKKEDYTSCMGDYVDCIDPTYGVYPLNDDLIYMIQNGGEQYGWWDVTNKSGSFMFEDIADLNVEIAWMFACCYVG